MTANHQPQDNYDAARNSREGYALAIRSWREICIRKGQITPDKLDPKEMRWASEGPCKQSELDSVRADG